MFSLTKECMIFAGLVFTGLLIIIPSAFYLYSELGEGLGSIAVTTLSGIVGMSITALDQKFNRKHAKVH